jgi:hypothetical protein
VTRAVRSVPDLLLGVTSLDLPARTTRDRMLEVAGRFREPESLAVTLVKALDAGAQAVYAVPSPRLRAALRELRRAVPVLARLPLTPPAGDLSYEHPLLVAAPDGEPGMPSGGLRAAATSLAMLPGTLSDDLAARVASRCEIEAPALGKGTWAGVAFAAPITDLALAAGHSRFFERMTRFGRARFGGLAGFETHNLGLLLARLQEWGIAPDFVMGAVNPRGFAMKPDRETVLAQIRSAGVPTIASELRAGGTVPLAEGARFALDSGARGLVAELVDMDDVAGELRALGG